MNQPSTTPLDFLHKEYPKQFKRNEFWRQIKRTVNGEPVSEREIEMIINQICDHLDLGPSDALLDLGCGNGALASRLFSRLDRYIGIDFSDFLLEVAKEFFSPHDGIRYQIADIRDVDSYANGNEETDKVLIYGCVAYLSKEDTAELLRNLKDRLPQLKKVFVGNIPLRERANEFYSNRSVDDFDLDDPTSTIGVWWEFDELIQLGSRLGYRATRHLMPSSFYGNHYRFDLLLEL